MLKFLKNPFGKEQEKQQRESADKHAKDSKEKKDKKAPQVKDAKKSDKKQDSKKEDKKSDTKKSDPKQSASKDTKLEAAHGVILKPHATEKTANAGSFDTYSFIVAKDANKIEIKKAFWRMYNHKPISIKIVNMPAKKVNFRRQAGVKGAWKKAYIRVEKGTNISVYEGV